MVVSRRLLDKTKGLFLYLKNRVKLIRVIKYEQCIETGADFRWLILEL